MKKSILFLLLFLIKSGFSQVYIVSEKDIQTTSRVYNSFLLELNSGETVLLQVEPRIEGMLLSIYDRQHHQRVDTIIKFEKLKDINSINLVRFIELDHKAVLFYTRFHKGIISFNRLTIDPSSGIYANSTLSSFDSGIKAFFEVTNCFIKVLKNQDENRYVTVLGYKAKSGEHIIETVWFGATDNLPGQKQTLTIEDCNSLELLDANIDQGAVYLCLNKKAEPKDPKDPIFKPTVNYIPENKVVVVKLGPGQSVKEHTLDLPNIIYSTKAQFVRNPTRHEMDLLLSAVNPADKYATVPATLNMFYRFSSSDMNPLLKKQLSNDYACKAAAAKYFGMEIDKNVFMNFPQNFFTDSLGNTYIIFQTVCHEYSKNNYINMFRKDLAIISYNKDLSPEHITFSPTLVRSGFYPVGALTHFSFDTQPEPIFTNMRASGNYWHSKFLRIGENTIIINNMRLEDLNKQICESIGLERTKNIFPPMIAICGKKSYTLEKIIKEPWVDNARFNFSSSSFNEVTRTFVIQTTMLGSKIEKLVWLRFK